MFGIGKALGSLALPGGGSGKTGLASRIRGAVAPLPAMAPMIPMAAPVPPPMPGAEDPQQANLMLRHVLSQRLGAGAPSAAPAAPAATGFRGLFRGR